MENRTEKTQKICFLVDNTSKKDIFWNGKISLRLYHTTEKGAWEAWYTYTNPKLSYEEVLDTYSLEHLSKDFASLEAFLQEQEVMND
jgi:hypothetical protein